MSRHHLMERVAAAGAGGVELLVEAATADASLLEGRDDPDEVRQGSGQAVKSPHHKGVPGPEAVEDLGQLRSVGLSAAGALDEEPVVRASASSSTWRSAF